MQHKKRPWLALALVADLPWWTFVDWYRHAQCTDSTVMLTTRATIDCIFIMLTFFSLTPTVRNRRTRAIPHLGVHGATAPVCILLIKLTHCRLPHALVELRALLAGLV